MMVTTDSKLMVCGNSKGNRFCEKDYDVTNIYNIKRFQNIKKDLINDLKIAMITTSDFHSLALTQDGIVLAWGGAISDNLGRRKSRLMDKKYIDRIQSRVNHRVTDSFNAINYNSDLLMPFY